VIDGLYRVVTPHLCAGFVVEDGRVTRCAPILRKRLTYWLTVAERLPGCSVDTFQQLTAQPSLLDS
jgi:hypothetical protein